MRLCTKSPDVYSPDKSNDWKCLHTDETGCCQVSLVNVVMTSLTEDDDIKTSCVSRSIIAEDGTADKQAHAIIGQFDNS